MEEKGVKELLELINAIKEVALLAKSALKDGKVGLEDLALLGALLQKQQSIVDGFSGLSDAKLELKDLSFEEAIQVLQALSAAAKEVKAA